MPHAMQIVGTVTITASASGSIAPKFNTPIRDLTIIVKPLNPDTQYAAAIYFFDELEEQHSFPTADSRVVMHSSFPRVFFPAISGTATIPKFFTPNREDFKGLPITITIGNNETATREFEVYAIFEDFPTFTSRVETQE